MPDPVLSQKGTLLKDFFGEVNVDRFVLDNRGIEQEAFDKILNLEYAREFQMKVIAEFESQLPEHPSW